MTHSKADTLNTNTTDLDSSQPAPKIEFPCENYPIKVVGNNTEHFLDFVISSVLAFDPHLDLERITTQNSRNERFQSVRLFITATGEEQLQALFQTLKASGRVHMVL